MRTIPEMMMVPISGSIYAVGFRDERPKGPIAMSHDVGQRNDLRSLRSLLGGLREDEDVLMNILK
jgi:hypothetical protein